MVEAFHAVSAAALIAGVAMVIVAALHDVMSRTVPNRLVVAIAGAGLLRQAAEVGTTDVRSGLAAAGFSIIAALGVFVAAALMWRRGWMGGADVKLLGASALMLPAAMVLPLLMATSLSGGVLSLLYLATRRRLARPRPGRAVSLSARVLKAERWRLRRGGPLPYAVAIACGALFVVTKVFASSGGLP